MKTLVALLLLCSMAQAQAPIDRAPNDRAPIDRAPAARAKSNRLPIDRATKDLITARAMQRAAQRRAQIAAQSAPSSTTRSTPSWSYLNLNPSGPLPRRIYASSPLPTLGN